MKIDKDEIFDRWKPIVGHTHTSIGPKNVKKRSDRCPTYQKICPIESEGIWRERLETSLQYAYDNSTTPEIITIDRYHNLIIRIN